MYQFRIIIFILFSLFLTNFTHAVEQFKPLNNELPVKELVIYSSLDVNLVGDIIQKFQESNQDVQVIYHDLQTFDIYEKIVKESDGLGATADFVFSSAMDLQVKLANDGYALKTILSASSAIPNYAQWRQMVFGLTNEAAVFVYNKKWFQNLKMPTTHDGLVAFLKTHNSKIFNKVATYDIERAGLGLFFMAQDQENYQNIWGLVSALGNSGVRLYSSSSAILQGVADGRFVIGYNILGSYAKIYAKTNPNLGIITPSDYTLMMSRIGLVPKFSRQPELGKRFLQFLASKQGQALLQQKTNSLSQQETRRNNKFRHVRIGPGLVVYQDQLKRQRLIGKWNEALKQN